MRHTSHFARTGLIALALLTPFAGAQSLLRDAPPPPEPDAPAPDPAKPLEATSLIQVEAPRPKQFQVHDLVTIIVSEQSKASSQAKLDTKKDTSARAKLSKFPDLAAFLEAQLRTGDRTPIVEAEVSSGNNFKGDGKYERTEGLSDRITATVIDVKPNGTLVLEARRTITKDNQTQTLVLSGHCRREDVTNANTVLSSQLAELTVAAESHGDVKDASQKGVITRFFEAVFNF